MTDCTAVQPLLLDRAAGVLQPAAGRALDDHLAACPACRAESSAFEETLGLARLPPPGPDELAALDGLAADLLRQRQAGRDRAATWTRAGAGIAVAAAMVAALALPAFWRKAPVLDGAAVSSPAASAAWEPPDPDDLLATAEAAWPSTEVGGATSATDEEGDLLLGAAEEWSELFPTVE